MTLLDGLLAHIAGIFILLLQLSFLCLSHVVGRVKWKATRLGLNSSPQSSNETRQGIRGRLTTLVSGAFLTTRDSKKTYDLRVDGSGRIIRVIHAA